MNDREQRDAYWAMCEARGREFHGHAILHGEAAAEAQRQADISSGRMYDWHAGQDAYERWLNEIAP